MFRTQLLAVFFAFCISAAICTPAARAQTFSNAAAINVSTSTSNGVATLYPSPITVTGAPTSISYVSVTLSGFSHTWVSDVNALLVSPTGQKFLLMANTCGGGDANNNTLTFIPDGSATLPPGITDVVSGVYACSVYAPQNLPAPAPAGPYEVSLAPLIGTNANGTWNLYVFDSFAPQDNGSFTGGWSITFNRTPALPTPTAFTYQGQLASGGTPITGNANVRFTLCNHPTQPTSFSSVGNSISRNLTGIANGLVTTSLDFGSVIDNPQQLWLNIEVESPPGSGFVTLSPRQPITPAPQARVAPWTGITGIPANVSGAFSPWAAGAGSSIYYTAGPVGIGTTTPASTLHVSTNSTVVGTIESSSTIGSWFNLLNTSAGGRYWRLISTGVSNGEGAGNLLIGHGTIPGSQTSVMTLISSTGNVGIGTVTPTQRLTVAGNVLANNVAVPSSGRFKHNVAPMTDALEKLLKLEGVSFDWNPDFAKDRPGREHDIGFVAEDVAKVFPEVVFFDAEGKVTGMDYSRLTAVAIQAIKQQQLQREADRLRFEEELTKRDAQNVELKDRLERLERALSKP